MKVDMKHDISILKKGTVLVKVCVHTHTHIYIYIWIFRQ